MAQTRAELQEKRRSIQELHDRGLSAIQVCAKLTAATDSAISRLWVSALEELSENESDAVASGCVLVAHGGYGRRQLAPHSDIDLMLLHQPGTHNTAKRVAKRLTQDIFDLGLDLGHSLRTIDDAVQLSTSDAKVATSLLESRPLIGSQPLYERFATALASSIRRRTAATCASFIESRRAEREKYGETVYLLEPNIKRSRGGLRDIHLLRWMWFVQTGVSDLDRLKSLGALSKFDHHRLCSSREFLLRVRNEMHFTRPGDALLRHEQLRIAEKFGYRESGGLRPVEQFMRDYFRHARHVWFLTNRLTDLNSPKTTVARVLEPVMAKSIEKDYRVGFTEISATQQGLEKLRRRADEVLRLLQLAREYDRRIAQETWYTIYRAAPNYAPKPDAGTCEQFLQILTKGEGLGMLLRRLHELAVLERIVPAYREARCLLQFNQYHKFTVDEHCLRSVDMATRFAERNDLLGETYRKLANPELLHLALLLHDLGKGRDGDHSVIGEAITRETAARLRLSDADGDRLALLVRWHLRMSHIAFRRDTSDPELIDQFAKLVGSQETLSMLFVLTCADMAAVGPGVLNDWKVSVLGQLYERTLEHLADAPHRTEDRRGATRTAVWQILSEAERDKSSTKLLFNDLPESFLVSRSPAAIAGVLRRLANLSDHAALSGPPTPSDMDVWGSYLGQEAEPGSDTLELVAAVARGVGQGVFASMAGALSSKGLSILSAETTVLSGGLLLLRFTAGDPRAAANAAEANRRVNSITTAMAHSVGSKEPPKLPRVWGEERVAASAALSANPNEVRIDTSLSEECAIVEIFTVDRPGLLYELAKAMHELELVIRFAKIATALDQVVDVFYLSQRDGTKPTDGELLARVSERVMQVIESDASV